MISLISPWTSFSVFSFRFAPFPVPTLALPCPRPPFAFGSVFGSSVWISNCHRSSVSSFSTDLIASTRRVMEAESSHSGGPMSGESFEGGSGRTLDLGEDGGEVLFERFVGCHEHGETVLLHHAASSSALNHQSGIGRKVPEVIGWVDSSLVEYTVVRDVGSAGEMLDRDEGSYLFTLYSKNSVTNAVEPLSVIA